MRTLIALLPALACAAMTLFVCLPMLRGRHTADTAEEKATNELVALRGELAHSPASSSPPTGHLGAKGGRRVIGRGWVAAAVVGLGALLAACGGTEGASSTRSQSAGQPVVEVGDKAPPFSLPSASGENVSLMDYRGQKPVLMYFSMGPG
jgi:hypothetical protein